MKPKLLFISPSSPFPARDGKRQRTLAMLLAVSQNYEVDFLILGSDSGLRPGTFPSISEVSFFSIPQDMDGFWIKKLGISYFPNLANKNRLKEFLKDKKYSKILCRYAIVAKDLPKGTPFVLDVDDDYSELMQTKISRQSTLFRKFRFGQIFVVNRIYYSKILRRANQLIWVRPNGNGTKVNVLSNLPFQMLLERKLDLIPPQNQSLLFIGKLSYPPNSDGIRWFLEKIWPGLIKDLQNITFSIISSVKPDPELDSLIQNSHRVIIKVDVEDLIQEYQNHGVCIVPIFFGGGSNVKLAEALLMGRKVISSTFGIRGYEQWVDSGLIQMATTSEDWKNKIQGVLQEPWEESPFLQIREEFSLEKWNQDLIKILDEA